MSYSSVAETMPAYEVIGVPFMPVSIVRTISRSLKPVRYEVAKVKSRVLMYFPPESNRLAADGPTPRPSVPWHFAHCNFAYTSRPLSTSRFLLGAGAIDIGFRLGAAAKAGEKVFT